MSSLSLPYQALFSSSIYARMKEKFISPFQARVRSPESSSNQNRPPSVSSELWLINERNVDIGNINKRVVKLLCGPLSDDEKTYIKEHKQEIVPFEVVECILALELFYDIEKKEEVTNLAKNFSSLVYTLGRENWEFMKGLYQKLANHFHPSIRAILAESIHEVANIVGEEHTGRDLLPLFEGFYRDNEDVRFGMVTHLFDFYLKVPEEARDRLIAYMAEFLTVEDIKKGRNWRVRKSFVRECIKLVNILPYSQVNEYIAPIALQLANDHIADVRLIGMALLAEVLSHFISTESCPISFVDKLLEDGRKNYLHSTAYRRRQNWCHFIKCVLRKKLASQALMLAIFEDDLLELSRDSMHFVRLLFCEALQHVDKDELYKYDRLLEQLASLTSTDPVLEIRLQAKIVMGQLDPDITKIEITEWKKKVQERELTMWEVKK